jgi:phosphatidylglycerol:prolipoprotein diacylglycerol transferase
MGFSGKIVMMAILFELPGNLPVYAFSLLLGVGTTLGIAWAVWQTNMDDKTFLAQTSVGVMFGSLLGGRLVYLVQEFGYTTQIWEPNPLFRLDGISWFGAFLGGLLTLLAIAWTSYQRFYVLLDALVPGLIVVTAFAWLGAWGMGRAYGMEAGNAWWGLPTTDEWGTVVARFPLQIAASLLTVFTGWAGDWLGHLTFVRRAAGRKSALTLLLLALGWIALDGLRADLTATRNGVRLDYWYALGCALVSVMLLLGTFITRQTHHQTEHP